MPHSHSVFTALTACFLLAACGGGGGGGGSSNSGSSNSGSSSVTERDVPRIASFDLQQAPESAKSTHANAVNALRREILDDNTLFASAISDATKQEMRNLSTDELIGSYPNQFAPVNDTQAEAAWRLGWTGKGVKVGFVDDFRETARRHDISPFEQGTVAVTHGLITSLVAKQIAPEADFNLSTIARPAQDNKISFLSDIFDEIGNLAADNWHIINISAGKGRIENNKRISAEAWQNQIDALRLADGFLPFARPSNQSGTLNSKTLIVFSGTNLGEVLREGEDNCRFGLENCELVPASIHDLRKDRGMANAGDRVIFVGTLTQGTNQIAPYATTAGALKYDYLVTDERSFRLNDPDGEGTSLAAPRVAGAAALVRQKFPNLSGAELKQVLLQSATDLGEPGVDEVYGYGKLNLLGALSPLGDMTR